MGIYDLKLNETIEITTDCITYHVTRVPGGWIYNQMRLDAGQISSTFVPFDNEYMREGNEQLETTSNCDIPVVSGSDFSKWDDVFGILAWSFKQTPSGEMSLDSEAAFKELNKIFEIKRR